MAQDTCGAPTRDYKGPHALFLSDGGAHQALPSAGLARGIAVAARRQEFGNSIAMIIEVIDVSFNER